MGFDLFGRGKYFAVNWEGWRHLFELGVESGWEPRGTRISTWAEHGHVREALDTYPSCRPGDWEGQYFSNDGQVVTAEDATAWADALESAIPSLRGRPSAMAPALVEKFIDFCRSGEFIVT